MLLLLPIIFFASSSFSTTICEEDIPSSLSLPPEGSAPTDAEVDDVGTASSIGLVVVSTLCSDEIDCDCTAISVVADKANDVDSSSSCATTAGNDNRGELLMLATSSLSC